MPCARSSFGVSWRPGVDPCCLFVVHFIYVSSRRPPLTASLCCLLFLCQVHYGILKFDHVRGEVPDGASFYWLRRYAPPLIYGSKHAILFQMALMPLTMARFSIASLSESIIESFIPLNRALAIHIRMGMTMIALVLFATVGFFVFYGLLCVTGDQEYCDRLTSEIMWTGIFITIFILLIAGTSVYRDRIPYEVFYAVHYTVFILYVITVAHTFDSVQRNHIKNRSQTFTWVSATLLYYLCDRAAMHINNKYKARLVASSAIAGSGGSKMIILKLRRPTLFEFKPGQYAFLRLNEIDSHWHPFSVASCPGSPFLEFYIEVFNDKNSWTSGLWNLLEGSGSCGTERIDQVAIDVDVMGPYGTSLAKTENFTHALCIGTGTGTYRKAEFAFLLVQPSICTSLTQRATLSVVLCLYRRGTDVESIQTTCPSADAARPQHVLGRTREATASYTSNQESRGAPQGVAGSKGTFCLSLWVDHYPAKEPA
jgi:FAD-binding domain/Ferric reductase like transmembrane component